jgi:predicted Zn-dependent peptidase
LESERFLHSVLREFFTEVDVVAEERRMRFDNTPDGRLYEAYQNKAFDQSPYKVPVIGYPEHIQTYTPELAKSFYEKYYVPSRMVIALVGNFDITETEAIVRKYFSRLPKKSDPKDDFAKEKLDTSYPREVIVTGKEEPRFYLGYHRPAHPDSADIVFDVIQNVFCEGRTSRLFKKLVLEEKKVAEIACYSSIPGARLDSMFTFYSMPLDGHTNVEIRDEIKKEIQKLQKTGPTEQELQIVKNNIDAELIYSLESNSGLASQLAFYESLTGNWEYIYELQDRVHKITMTEVQEVVQKYLVPEREVTAYFEQEKK